MKVILELSIFVLFSLQGNVAFSSPIQDIYLIRHAETISGDSKDPSLTDIGKQRARNLSKLLISKNIKKIYSTDFKRTKQTVEPLAEKLGISIDLYDPKKLKIFSRKLLEEKINSLVVGHSNTTNSLAFLLGGNAFGDIDDSEYDRLYFLKIDGQKVESKLLHSKPFKIIPIAPNIRFNPDLYFIGELFFEMSLSGEKMGESIHKFEKIEDGWLLHEKTQIEKYNINADISVRLNSCDFSPLKMEMKGSMGTPVAIDLKWSDRNRLTGHSLQRRAIYKPQGDIAIDKKFESLQVERTSALMLAHLLMVPKTKSYAFRWYNAYDNDSRVIEVSYLGEETVTVPAGKFKTYKLQLLGGAPSQIYYISQEEQPKVVKIEIIASPWSYELKSFDIIN